MINTEMQKRAARVLIKFCRDHDYLVKSLSDIKKCLKALESGDLPKAIGAYQSVPLGGMGCFNDWFPPVKFKNETPDYVSDLFEVLVAHWSISMKHLTEKSSSK